MAAVVRWVLVGLALAGGAARAQGPCLADGPTRIADIELATGFSDPTHHAQWNGIDYFQAAPSSTGAELYRSDGTEAGTWIVSDVEPGWNGSDARGLTPAASRLYFLADRSGSTWLMRTDGTPAGTEPVRPVDVQDPFHRAVLGDDIYWTWSNELWVSDGTTSGTRIVTTITDAWDVEDVVALNGLLLIRVETRAAGAEPWISDGTDAGTMLLADLAPGDSSGLLGGFTVAGGVAYFSGSIDGNSFEPWVTDGTPGGTQRIRSTPGPAGLSRARAFGSRVAFAGGADPFPSARPWISDGTDAGTYPLDSATVPVDSPDSFTDAGAQLFFEGRASDGTSWLWVSDGTPGSATPVIELAPAWAPAPVLSGTGTAGGLLFYEGQDDDGLLWRSDGTPGGTFVVHSGGVFACCSEGPMGRVGTTVLFAGDHPDTSMELWRSDGSVAGTSLVKDIDADTGSSAPDWLTPVGDRVVFTANTRATGTELWISDLTAAGTRALPELAAGSAGDSPRLLTAAGERVFLFAGLSRPRLAVVNVTDETVSTVTDFPGATILVDPGPPIAAGARIVWPMSDGVTGRELWTSDGTAAGTASLDLAPGAAASDPQELTPLAGRVLFTATTPATGRELFVTDGTPAGTRLVADLAPGTASSSLGRLSSREDGVAWFLLVAGGGSELWRTDGTEAGTRRVEILNPDARYAQDRAAWIGDWLLVPRHDGITGQEPWRSDGDTPGMRLLFDIEPGILSSAPRRITPSGTRAWFTIERGTTSELWTSDGEAETVQLTLLPGRGSVAGLTAGGATVFHAAADGEPFFLARLAGGSPPGVTDVPGVRVEGVDPGGTEGRKVAFVAGRFVFAGFEESAGVELWTLSADGDCDGAADASDVCPWVADPGQEDSDADGVGDACDVASDDADGDGVTVTEDCDDADAATWRAPEEVRGVRVSRSAGVVTVSWEDASPRSGPAVRAEILGDALGRWDRAAPFATASCLLRDLPGTSAELDRTGSWWAIVRARVSGCGAGPAGAAGLDAVSCP